MEQLYLFKHAEQETKKGVTGKQYHEWLLFVDGLLVITLVLLARAFTC